MMYKYWPAVGNAHTYIHAAIELMKENDVDLIGSRKCESTLATFSNACVTVRLRQVPGTLVDAKFSLPFLVALSLPKAR